MSKRVNSLTIGVPTFGNFTFTKMTLEHVKRTVKLPYRLFVVVGKPSDWDTASYCKSSGIPYSKHTTNRGLPASINDIYDFAFNTKSSDDAVVIIGNDVLPYWGAIDRLVDVANATEYEWVSGTEISYTKLVSRYPDVKYQFHGGKDGRNFNGDSFPFWLDCFTPDNDVSDIVDISGQAVIGDSHNLCLLVKSFFTKTGYIDVNFYPCYFEDNDIAYRAKLCGCKMCRVTDSLYFHFWSRTIHQGGMKQVNDKYFPLNKEYYIKKWGGEPGREKFNVPFNGKGFSIGRMSTSGSINITSRENEHGFIFEWQRK